MDAVRLFQVPTRVFHGWGASGALAEHVRGLGARRPLVVTDAGVRAAGIVERLLAPFAAAGLEATVFDAVSANPRDHECAAGAEAARASGADAVVALGGGSPMDAAKAIAALATNGGTAQAWRKPRTLALDPLPIVAVPTTAGTASEVTFGAVVTDTAERIKFTVKDARLAPRAALVDPELTLSLPPAVTAATGMDALTHAVEAATCRPATPITDALALHAVRLVARHLPAAVRDGGDRAAREGMLLASLISGLAFANSDVAAVHCLAEAVGGRYDTPHGVANAVFLPPVFAHNAPAAPERHAAVAAALGVAADGRPAEEVAAEGAARLRALAAEVGIPRLRDLPGFDPADFPAIAEAAARNESNPSNARELDAAGYEGLLRGAWEAGI